MAEKAELYRQLADVNREIRQARKEISLCETIEPVSYTHLITGDKAGAEAFQKEHPEEWALGKQAYENIQQYGSPTWYEWCNKNWGTKWNAYSCVELGKDDDTLEFFTAWRDVYKRQAGGCP